MAERIVGIDLGTTNSEVAAYKDGRVRVLGPAGEEVFPSVVGLSPEGKLLVGREARNQAFLYPERTIASIKRRMGMPERIALGDGRELTPAEVSALILRALRERAEAALGEPVSKAVITVPAYFSDAQRQATREAGELAGLEVARLINEPTAASLAYGSGEAGDGAEDGRTILVYDLGGGTLDVSVVAVRGKVTEVLASHGDTHLGGDDFDALLVRHIVERFPPAAELGLEHDRRAMARIRRAAEEAKFALSTAPYARVREEHIATTKRGVPVHLDLEIARADFERLIRPLLERSLESVERAVKDAGLSPGDLAEVLLVGGSTRIPLVAALVGEATGLVPRRDLHPELCVALGAGIAAARLGGQDPGRVLVDVTPYTFGVSYLGELDGRWGPHCFQPLIRRNTPIPVSATESFYTHFDGQEGWDVEVFQGEERDARRNIRIGEFKAEGFSRVPAPNEILCRMDLDLDGILHVTAIEKRTGRRTKMTIEGATKPLDEAGLAEGRARVLSLYRKRERAAPETAAGEARFAAAPEEAETAAGGPDGGDGGAGEAPSAVREARELVEKARALAAGMDAEDRREAESRAAAIEEAIRAADFDRLADEVADLSDLVYYAGAR